MHLKSPSERSVYRSTSVAEYAQDGETHTCGKGRNAFSTQSQRFIVFECRSDQNVISCEFSIEERWDDYSRVLRSVISRKDGVTTVWGTGGPRQYTVKLSHEQFHFSHYGQAHSNLSYEDSLLIRAFETAAPDVATSIYHQIFHKIMLDPETTSYLENPEHTPGLLETLVPEFFKTHIGRILHERERQVKEILEA